MFLSVTGGLQEVWGGLDERVMWLGGGQSDVHLVCLRKPFLEGFYTGIGILYPLGTSPKLVTLSSFWRQPEGTSAHAELIVGQTGTGSSVGLLDDDVNFEAGQRTVLVLWNSG